MSDNESIDIRTCLDYHAHAMSHKNVRKKISNTLNHKICTATRGTIHSSVNAPHNFGAPKHLL